jgi:hypothetical protein
MKQKLNIMMDASIKQCPGVWDKMLRIWVLTNIMQAQSVFIKVQIKLNESSRAGEITREITLQIMFSHDSCMLFYILKYISNTWYIKLL